MTRGRAAGPRAAGSRAVAWACAALLVPAVAWAGPERPVGRGSGGGTARARFLMGTRLSIEIDGPIPQRATDGAFDEVARLEGILSNWRATSELSRLNATAARSDFACSDDLYRAVRVSLEWAERTGGAFDPTVEPLVRALGLRHEEGRADRAPEPPAGAVPGRPLPIGHGHVRLEPSARSVRFDAEGVGLDLGGIGKGIALDAAARVLARAGVRSALLDFGGQVLAIGRPRGGCGWEVGLADPGDRDAPVGVVRVADVSVATSGNGERSVPGPSGPIGHILDPVTQRPATFAGTTTVIAPDGTTADALSTALFVMGPERGLPWAESRGIPVIYLWRDRDGALRHLATGAFEARHLEWIAEPGP